MQGFQIGENLRRHAQGHRVGADRLPPILHLGQELLVEVQGGESAGKGHQRERVSRRAARESARRLQSVHPHGFAVEVVEQLDIHECCDEATPLREIDLHRVVLGAQHLFKAAEQAGLHETAVQGASLRNSSRRGSCGRGSCGRGG